MQKIVILSLICIIFSSCSILESQEKNDSSTGTNIVTNSGNVEKNLDTKPREKTKSEKIADLRKKIALKGLIKKGDINLKNQEYTNALVKYLQILKDIPDDESTIQKLGDTYFGLKNFKKSYEYYSKIKSYDKLNKNKAVLALFSSNKITNEVDEGKTISGIQYIKYELKTLNLNSEQYFYYNNSILCTQDFHLCKKGFQDFFEEQNKLKEEQKKGTGSLNVEINNNNKFEPLYNIEKSLNNYENFQIDDLSYKGALISGAFFEDGFHKIAIATAKIILKERKNYKPLLKIISKSYFELGDYVNAKVYMIKYNKIESYDPNASYFLGIIYEKLNEYMLSTIHFQKALKIGYNNTLDIKKRILVNYYELGDIDRMLEIFKKMIEENEEELIDEDYSMAIYYHIINDKFEEAKKIAETATKRYSENEIFYGYLGWIEMNEADMLKKRNSEINTNNTNTGSTESDYEKAIKEKLTLAEENINKGFELNSKNPMITLVKGKLELIKGDTKKAFLYFKQTVTIDKNGDFGKIAKEELNKLEK